MEKLIPLGDRIVVRVAEAKDMTEGGIVLPDAAKEKPMRGEIVAIGPGKRGRENEHIKPLSGRDCWHEEGSTVLFGKYAGSVVEINGKDLLILSEDDILAVIEDGHGK